MQARPKIVKILVVALIVSLFLGACGGGTTGKTWFNVPSIVLRMQPNGTARVFGFNVGYVIDPAMIQTLQSAQVQRAEVRIGYHGIFIYFNGEPLPYIRWDQASVVTLQDLLARQTMVHVQPMVINQLPLMRTFGLGVALDIPRPAGAAQLTIPRWRGEMTAIAETPANVIGPITIGSLVFDESGEAIIEGVPVSRLEQALGISLPLRLDANTLATLQRMNVESVRVATRPNGVDLFWNERPLPSVAYDSRSLTNLSRYVGPLVDEETMATLDQVLPILQALALNVVVSFTGEQLVTTELPAVTAVIAEDGTMSLFGLPLLPEPVLDPALLEGLQRANVQRLSVSLQPEGIFIAANNQTLPTITWTEESLDVLARVVAPLTGLPADLMLSLVDVARTTGVNVQVQLPLAEGAEPVDLEPVETELQPPDLTDVPESVIRLSMGLEGDQIRSIGTLDSEDLEQLGVDLPTLPPDLAETLRSLGVNELALNTDPGVLTVLLDGDTALTVNYDYDSLMTALELAATFLDDTILSDPVMAEFLREQIVPLAPGADIHVVVRVQ
jgi:hypothetical protein